ncbi:MAG: isoleucine--tRNA ligase [Candidatus Omnitrophica bacterium]|nr:isoleucine--tRNA ligase [Candidatus Omnitrophota bacterium]
MKQKSTDKGYKETLNLPRTEFPMKANLPQREPETLEKWGKEDIYGAIIKKREHSSRSFILHDGPPYANGHIHMGHVLNKTLKDICVKYFSMKGYYAPYVPGWDCHGLPVEHQLLKELKVSKHDVDQVDFRRKAYDYAMKFVKIQSEEFKRLGIFGDWEKPYLTLTKEYESSILTALADLFEKGYIYKDLKPVNWCKSCETALAEAEVEYEDKESPSIYIKFRTEKDEAGKKTFFIVWTTTPWTLVANVAVALHPDLEYSLVDTGEEVWIMASELVDKIAEKAYLEGHRIVRRMSGDAVAREFASSRHPFLDRVSVTVTAGYVTKEEGTGCVHTAPGHGQDDYITGRKYGLQIIMPVDDRGRFKAEAGDLAGMDVYDANERIIEKLSLSGTLVREDKVKHSYPHCWRCKRPIIFRATEQWFMNIEHDGLRERLVKAIGSEVKWVPVSGRERIKAMVEGRPDWCLSRQRYWGVPIPAFKCVSCGSSFSSAGLIRSVAGLTAREGSNAWFEKDADGLLPAGTVCASCGSSEFVKEGDILDVWFDSGVSHKAVLEAREGLSSPADLYLEGSDQHRGWFQSSLITSMGMCGRPPYKQVLTHGFVVDGDGKKMSKSLGNVIKPQDIMKKYGADILRLWVASSDYEGDIKLSTEILDRLADGYRKIRNTFRFLLSNLYDFDPATDAVGARSMEEIDRWVLSRLVSLVEKVTENYDAWDFYKVYRSIYDFCVYEVSAFYLDVLKDSLYVDLAHSPRRRSHQTGMFMLLETLDKMLAPLMPFTSDEVWGYAGLPGKEKSVHMSDWPDVQGMRKVYKDEDLDRKWAGILSLRDEVMKALERNRENGLIGSSLEAKVIFHSSDADAGELVSGDPRLLAELFKVSKVTLVEKPMEGMDPVGDGKLSIKIEKARGNKCQRCWNYRDEVGTIGDAPELCARCHDVINERSHDGQEGRK